MLNVTFYAFMKTGIAGVSGRSNMHYLMDGGIGLLEMKDTLSGQYKTRTSHVFKEAEAFLSSTNTGSRRSFKCQIILMCFFPAGSLNYRGLRAKPYK